MELANYMSGLIEGNGPKADKIEWRSVHHVLITVSPW